MEVLPALNLVFIHVHKNAGKSVRSFLRKLSERLPVKTGYHAYYKNQWNGEEVHGHIKAGQVISKFPELSSYFKFSVSRNTWDRIASSYFYIKSKSSESAGWNAGHLETCPTFESYVCRLYETWKNMKGSEKSFYIYGIESKNIFSKKRMIYPSQCAYFWDNFESRTMLIDKLCRLEFLENDLLEMFTEMGMGTTVRGIKFNKAGVSPRANYRELYSSRMVDMIAEIYAAEIKFLKCKFE